MTDRRTYLKRIAAVGTIGALAGCSGGDGESTPTAEPADAGDDSTPTASPTPTDSPTPTAEPTPTPEPTPTATPVEESLQFGGDREVNMGLSPSVPQSNLYVQYGPVRDYLEDNLEANYDVPQGLNVDMNVGTNYSAVIQSLGEGTLDIAETGPFAAALGVLTDNAEVIIQRYGYGSWEYSSIIATPSGSDISSLSDLSGKTVAFSDRLSTSGCLYPLYSMSTEGDLEVGALPEGNGSQAEFDARFAGGHVQSYTLLEQGQVDAAAMGAFVRDTGTGPAPEDFESVASTLHEDTGLPRAPIVVSPELSDAAKTALKQSLLQAPDSIYKGADGADGGGDDLWFSDMREASVDRYQSVIDVANELDVGQNIFEQ